MTFVDWLIVAFTVLLALRGYTRGLLVGVLTLAGFLAGAYVGGRVAPLVLPAGAHSRYAPLFALAGALLLGGVLASGLEGVAWFARGHVRIPGLVLVDGIFGAIFTGCVALAISWIVGAVVLQSSGSQQLRSDVQRSVILSALNGVLPPSGTILNALARIDPLPSLTGPPADVPAPTRGILGAGGVRLASRSVVRVLGTACGLGVEGSGWVAAPGLVVTNAHVVAGESDTVVQVHGEAPSLPAKPVLFDVHNDIAVLRVTGLSEPSLSLSAAPAAGQSGAILGYPLDGPFDAQPGRLGSTGMTSTENAYGQGPVQRSIVSLRGLVRPGNSGGPIVDAGGRVIGTVFAAITDTPPNQPGGLAVPDSVLRREIGRAEAARAPIGSGQCTG